MAANLHLGNVKGLCHEIFTYEELIVVISSQLVGNS